MDDKKIVELFLERNEDAVKKSSEKYGKYCYFIANNILDCAEDSEECVNDTLLRAWNSIPPNKPDSLKAYLGRIARNLALDTYHRKKAQKRSSHIELAYDEISELVSLDASSDTDATNEIAVKNAINEFLASLTSEKRIIFMQRYWYLCSVKDIAEKNGMSQANVKITLMRLRGQLKKFLEKEGINL